MTAPIGVEILKKNLKKIGILIGVFWANFTNSAAFSAPAPNMNDLGRHLTEALKQVQAAAPAAQVAAHKAATSSSAAGSAWRAEVVPADMAAARRLSLPLGALAGVFGSVAGRERP